MRMREVAMAHYIAVEAEGIEGGASAGRGEDRAARRAGRWWALRRRVKTEGYLLLLVLPPCDRH